MKFTTATGSVYEVNTDSKQIRRLTGVKDPTPRQGKDGEWRTYIDTTPIKVGQQLLIRWGDDTEASPEGKILEADGMAVIKTTITSPVASIEP